MKIGIDLDGVVFNTERKIMFYADEWSYFNLKRPKLRNDELEPEKCYNWTNEEIDYFYTTYFDKATQESALTPGAKETLERLKKEGHQIYVITYRGEYRRQEIIDAEALLKQINIEFDGKYWGVFNKMEKCKELGINVYIDDNPSKIEQFASYPINVLYFKDTGIRSTKNKNAKTVYNWMDIYKEIAQSSKNSH